jgi:protoporphyrinogen oxidase
MLANAPRYAILGGGLAGLSAGWYLAGQGGRVRLLERDNQVGGMALTIQQDEYRFDLGPHRFHTHDEVVLNLVTGLLGDELLRHDRRSRVRLDGRYLDYPPNVPSLVRNLNPRTSVRCLLDYFHATWKRRGTKSEADDFQSWVVRHFGRHLYDIYFGPYTWKVWGTSPHLLSADLARRRITVPNLGDVLLRLMVSSKRDPGPYVTEFWYPKNGVGRIAERLAEEIVVRQGQVHLEHTVEALHLVDNRIVGITVTCQGRRDTFDCEQVISSLPLPQLIRLIDPPAEQGLLQAAAALRHRALIFVFLMLDSPQLTQEHWLYFPEPDTIFNRLTEPRNFSPNHAPPDKTSLCAEITCFLGDATWRMSSETLARRVITDLAKTGLLDPSCVEGSFTRRMPNGYPVYHVGYQDHLNRLVQYVAGIENLITCGRLGTFDYTNMAGAMASGLAAAEKSILSADQPVDLPEGGGQ